MPPTVTTARGGVKVVKVVHIPIETFDLLTTYAIETDQTVMRVINDMLVAGLAVHGVKPGERDR